MGITFRLAWRNIWRHPRRTGLTLAAIVFSDALLVWMIGLQLGQYDMMIDNTLRAFTGHFQIQAEGYLDKPQMQRTIPVAAHLAQRIRETTGLESVAVRAMGFALVSSTSRSYGAQIVGVQPRFEPQVSIIPGLLKEGRYLKGDMAQEAVVGRVMARNLKLKVGDELTLLGSGKDGAFAAAVVPIVGIFESATAELDRYLVQIPLGTFQDIFFMGDHAHVIVVSGTELDQAPQLINQIAPLLPDQGNLVLLDWERLQPGLKQAIDADFYSAWIMYAVLIIMVTFSALNTFLMSVLERTREFGIMLALGLTPGRIGRLVLLESTFMALTGFVLGTVVGAILTGYFVVYGLTYPGMEEMASKFNLPSRIYPELSLMSVTLGPAVIFVATLVAALYPALRIHFLKPVEAMETV